LTKYKFRCIILSLFHKLRIYKEYTEKRGVFMKLILKLFCFTAVIGFFTLPLTGCVEKIEVLPPLKGNITVRIVYGEVTELPWYGPVVNCILKAEYDGPEPNIIWNWRGPINAAGNTFTPTKAGTYIVSASSNGYSSKTLKIEVKEDPRIPTADYFKIDNLAQKKDSFVDIKISANNDIEALYGELLNGDMYKYYEGINLTKYTKNKEPPIGIAGTFSVTFDVNEASSFYKAVGGLFAGTLMICDTYVDKAQDLRDYLDTQPANTPETPLYINIETKTINLKGDRYNKTVTGVDESGSVGAVIYEYNENESKTRYIFLDLNRIKVAITTTTEIPDYAFVDVNNLVGIIIPDTVEKIGTSAFDNCTNFKYVIIGKGVTEIGNNAFSKTKIEKITIPNSVTSIGDSAFDGCGSLTSVTFEGKINSENLGSLPGDLRGKYLAGGIGTYTRKDGNSNIWTKSKS